MLRRLFSQKVPDPYLPLEIDGQKWSYVRGDTKTPLLRESIGNKHLAVVNRNSHLSNLSTPLSVSLVKYLASLSFKAKTTTWGSFDFREMFAMVYKLNLIRVLVAMECGRGRVSSEK